MELDYFHLYQMLYIILLFVIFFVLSSFLFYLQCLHVIGFKGTLKDFNE
jgi:hypothetical protein